MKDFSIKIEINNCEEEFNIKRANLNNGPQKHHYVPQCYLRGFSTDGINISFYDKISNKLDHRIIEEICQIENFYYLEHSTNPYFIETTFFANDNEDKLGRLLCTLSKVDINSSYIPFNEGLRKKISKQIILQYMRTPKYRDIKSRNSKNAFFYQIECLLLDIFNCEMKDIQFKGDEPEFHKRLLLDDGMIQEMIIDISEADWEFLYTKSNEFYTSDNPIVINARNDMPVTYCDAIRFFDEIFYTINPNLLLHIMAQPCRTLKRVYLKEIKEYELKEVNALVQNNAERYVFYKKEFEF